MTEDQSNAALAAMTAQREQELAGVEAHYRLRKACTARAVELYEALKWTRTGAGRFWSYSDLDQLLADIEKDAQS